MIIKIYPDNHCYNHWSNYDNAIRRGLKDLPLFRNDNRASKPQQ